MRDLLFISNFAYCYGCIFGRQYTLLFLIFCVLGNGVRPSFGYDRQILVNDILLSSSKKEVNVIWRYNGLPVNDHQWSSIAAGYLVI